jgi:hypothetical protein
LHLRHICAEYWQLVHIALDAGHCSQDIPNVVPVRPHTILKHLQTVTVHTCASQAFLSEISERASAVLRRVSAVFGKERYVMGKSISFILSSLTSVQNHSRRVKLFERGER